MYCISKNPPVLCSGAKPSMLLVVERLSDSYAVFVDMRHHREALSILREEGIRIEKCHKINPL